MKRATMRSLLAAGVLTVLSGCAGHEPVKVPPPPKSKLLEVHLALVPPPQGEWQFEAKCESGVVERRTGSGDTIELELPPGPCWLRLTTDNHVFERALVLGRQPVKGEIWQLVGGRRL